ncbi:hypothetical protein CLU79DRAFT_840815 [Phycomyces nitens]|nr:hypothetical protein CLU79DRAFT_840815 [Phycomyces nitens]
MERSLMDYDNSLEELDRQKKQLEIVMKRMGEEWEESGAGIGWLGSLKDTKETEPSPPVDQPLFSNILSEDSGPIPEYLQSLLNVNEALLAQSCLANQQSTAPPLLNLDSNDLSSTSSSSGPDTPEEESTSDQKIPLSFY